MDTSKERKTFMDAVVKATRIIRNHSLDQWAIIGSTALYVRNLSQEIPTDIDIIVSKRDMQTIATNLGVPFPEQTSGDEERLRSYRFSYPIQDTGVVMDIACELEYFSPIGKFEKINPNELSTEYVNTYDGYIWNVVTSGTYMSLAGRFNREKDRTILKKLYDLHGDMSKTSE